MKIPFKHILFRFIILLIPYLVFYFMFAESNFKGQTYELDKLPLYLFFALFVYLFAETFLWKYMKNRSKLIANIGLMVFFILLYFILPHRNFFN
jgi:dolichol kinase